MNMAKKVNKGKKTLSFVNSKHGKNILIALTSLLIGVTGTVLTYDSFAASAGKGGGGGSYSGKINGTTFVEDTNSNGQVNWNDTITFSVTSNYPAGGAGPWVDLYCYQNGNFAYSQTAGFGTDYPWPANYKLASAYWTSGPANCTATLYSNGKNGRHINMGTYQFDVQG
jgi:hypothetical protein